MQIKFIFFQMLQNVSSFEQKKLFKNYSEINLLQVKIRHTSKDFL